MVSSDQRRVTPFADDEARFRAGRIGMWLFLASLAMLFAASLVGFVVLRIQLRDVWPQDMPPLPGMMVLSTAVLVASSGPMVGASWAAKWDMSGALRVALLVTLLFGLAFLFMQALAWRDWLPLMAERLGQTAGARDHRYALASFFILTGLHAAHVIGGLVFLIMALANAFRFTAGRNRALVNHVALYWHFLDGVWLVLYATLLIGL